MIEGAVNMIIVMVEAVVGLRDVSGFASDSNSDSDSEESLFSDRCDNGPVRILHVVGR